MNKLFLLVAIVLSPFFVFSQTKSTSTVTGKIVYPNTGAPVENAKVDFIEGDKTVSVTTDKDGSFKITLPYGEYNMNVHAADLNYSPDGIIVNTPDMALGDIKLENAVSNDKALSLQETLPTVTVSEGDLEDASSQSVSSVLGAARDIFISTASYTMSSARFDIRGYSDENFATYLNGIPVNSLETGVASWGQWGGLNNVFYNRESRLGLQHSDFTFGALGGAYALDSRAATQRKQLEVSYANANRNYRHRLMATYSTGLLKGGWAVSVSASRRWAKEGYIPGTFYDSYSYFASVQKYFGNKQSLNLTVLGAPTRSGGSFNAIQEMYDLAGSHYYNPNWGYQNGEKRNVAVTKTHQPMFILTHEIKFNDKQNLLTSAGFSFGERSRGGFDWNNASNPAPDYYAYLPSYQTDSTLKQEIADKLRSSESARQINWDRLYEANRLSNETIRNVDGIQGNNVSGKRSRYIVQQMVQDMRKFDFNTIYNNALSEHFSLSAGLTYQFQRNEFFRRVTDLLGGDFYVDLNQFAQRDFPTNPDAAQNDLNHPNRILRVGDKYGYDYFVTIHRAEGWAQVVAKYNHVDFFVAAKLSNTDYWRKGMTRNGLFPDTSYGLSAKKMFINPSVKAGATYKINGRNYLYLNGLYESRAPYFDDIMLSPRTRNMYVDNVKNENIYSLEAGYQLRIPNLLALKLNGYYTLFTNETNAIRYYSDAENTFVNYTMTGINTRHMGLELGADAKIYKGFGASAVIAMGRYQYTNRPLATTTADNKGGAFQKNEVVYAKNFNVGGTPQFASSFGLKYNSPQFWRVEVDLNYYDWMWLRINPSRRTEAAIDQVEPNSAQWNSIIAQERLKGQFTMDIRASYNWLMNNNIKGLKKKLYLVFSLNVTNVTNNRNFITGGAEQSRYDSRFNNVGKFPSKYYYGYGITYFVSVAFRMN